jgi:hypothetical protein
MNVELYLQFLIYHKDIYRKNKVVNIEFIVKFADLSIKRIEGH